jgi:hypothetical protein
MYGYHAKKHTEVLMPELLAAKIIIHSMPPELIDAGKTIRMDF